MTVRRKQKKAFVSTETDTAAIFQAVAEMADVGIFDVSLESGTLIDCNPAFIKILGYEHKKEVMQLDVQKDLYAVSEDVHCLQRLLKREGSVTKHEIALAGKSGAAVPVLITAKVSRNEGGDIIGYQGLVIDISERLTIEHDLKEKYGFLTSLLESSVDCIVATDRKGIIIFFNKAAEKVLGYRADEVIGSYHISRLYSLAMAKDIMHKLRSNDYGGRGKLDQFRFSMYGKDGVEIPVSLSASIVYKDAQEIATLGIFTDLREKLKMEKELQETQLRLLQAEKMGSLGSLAAGVAHEVNNPLGGILIYASLLQEEFEAVGDPRVEEMKKIVDETTRCKEIVRSLLEFGRQTESRFEPMDINKAILDGLFFLEKQVIFHDIRIIKALDPDVPFVQGNPNQLKQVFMNIMVNAAEAMSDTGGQLTITTGKRKDGTSVFISFKDTGPGIPPNIHSKIFDPFFTTKEVGKGTGLGLSTSYGIVQSHHGTIEVKSKTGKHTVFTIILPLVDRRKV